MESEGSAGGAAPREGGEARTPARYCAVYTCLHNHKTHPHLSYFTIPSAPRRRLKWLKKIRRMDILKNGKVSAYHRVCEVHFRPEDIGLNSTGTRRRVGPRAAPALRLPEGDRFVAVHASPPRAAPASPPAAAPPRVRNLAASAPEVFEYVDHAPRKPAGRRPPPPAEPPRRRAPPPPPPAAGPLADFFAACDRHLTPAMAEFVKRIAQLRRRDAEETSDGLRRLGARLLAGAPAAYRALAPALALPPPSRALLRRLDSQDLLRLRVERMTDAERHCTVGLYCLDVRPHLYYDITGDRLVGLHELDGVQEPWPARRCAVLAARARGGGWALPAALAHEARPGALRAWLDGQLRRLRAAGLRVRALVADPALPPAARPPAVDAARPFFDLDGHKIYFLYDPPRLMRLLLLNFMTYDFHFEGTVARWADIVRYRELERHRPLSAAPRLAGLPPGPAAPRRVRALRPRRAARLLPRSLAAALAAEVERGSLESSATATVKLIVQINDLYDILDSAAGAGVATGDSGAAGFLSYMKSFFGGLKLRDRSGAESPEGKEFAECWRITIAAVLALRGEAPPPGRRWDPRRMHLDDRVATVARRAAGGRPTCRQVETVFERRFLDAVIRSTAEEAPVDLNEFLARANATEAAAAGGPGRFEFEEEADVRGEEYRRGRRRTLAGAAARLLRAARRRHGDCAAAARYLAAPPDASLLELLRQLDAALLAALRAPRQAARGRVADLLLDVHVLECAAPCGCFPLQFLKKLFLRMRLYDVLRQNRAALRRRGADLEFHLDALE